MTIFCATDLINLFANAGSGGYFAVDEKCITGAVLAALWVDVHKPAGFTPAHSRLTPGYAQDSFRRNTRGSLHLRSTVQQVIHMFTVPMTAIKALDIESHS